MGNDAVIDDRRFSSGMLLDADVLIDYVKVDFRYLVSMILQIGQMYVVQAVVKEVEDIEDDLFDSGIVIVEPDIEDLFKAGEPPSGLSFQDYLCLLTAKRHGLICMTNDKKLRKECRKAETRTERGLWPLIILTKEGKIRKKDALEVAKSIRENNPRHITSQILMDLEKRL